MAGSIFKKMWKKLKSFLYQCKVTLRLTRRPTRDEFKRISLICAIGILIIGSIGFLIYLVNFYLF